MNRYLGWALASIISIASFGNAMAADMAVKARPMPPPVAAVYDWTGWYVGGNVGYGWGANTDPGITAVDPGNQSGIGPFLTTGLIPGISGNFYPNLNPSGVFGGAQAGYDRQFGSWVLGVVADIQASDFKDNRLVSTPTTTCCNADENLSAKIDWFGTVRGKIGFAANDWLFYGTGGLAYGDVKSNIGFFCTPGGVGCAAATIGFAGSATEVKAGWAAGAGIAKAWGNWNVGVEYLHIDLGRSAVTTVSTTGFFTTTSITGTQRFAEDMVRLTVNYKWGAPLVARY
jgi:outer membrane immunogenic protein